MLPRVPLPNPSSNMFQCTCRYANWYKVSSAAATKHCVVGIVCACSCIEDLEGRCGMGGGHARACTRMHAPATNSLALACLRSAAAAAHACGITGSSSQAWSNTTRNSSTH